MHGEIELESIEDYNTRKRREYFEKGYTGIACPNCGNELQDENPGMQLLTYPPKKGVKCFCCGYSTMVYA